MINETLFIDKIKRMLPSYGGDVVVGVGDDAAVIRSDRGKSIVITCDSQVEGVHFTRANFFEIYSGKQLGQRAVAVALSDIAAMGGKPLHLLISLIMPVHLGGVHSATPEVVLRPRRTSGVKSFIDDLYEGFIIACKKYGIDIIGGNISSGKQLVIDIFVLGEIEEKNIIRRSGARPGDLVLVTGTLGKSKIPIARIKEGQLFAKSGVVTSMIDISDGLSTDLLHICDESKVGVRIYADKLPVAKGVSVNKALNGGEDYELCLTATRKDPSTPLRASAEELIAEIRGKTGTKVTIVGEILKKKEGRWVVDAKGRERRLEAGGWDHFLRLSS